MPSRPDSSVTRSLEMLWFKRFPVQQFSLGFIIGLLLFNLHPLFALGVLFLGALLIRKTIGFGLIGLLLSLVLSAFYEKESSSIFQGESCLSDTTLKVTQVFANNGAAAEVTHSNQIGKIYISGASLPQLEKGLRIHGDWKVTPLGDSSFDHFLRSKGYSGKASLMKLHDIKATEPSVFDKINTTLKQRFKDGMAQGIRDHPDLVIIAQSLVLGEVIHEHPDLKQQFKEAGLLHLFSVSGLHVTLVFTLLWQLTTFFTPSKSTLILSLQLVVMTAYIWLTGAHLPAIRAGVMIFLFSMAWHYELKTSFLSVFLITSVLFLIPDPQQLYDLSFQLSFGVTAALIGGIYLLFQRSRSWLGWDSLLPRLYYSKFQSFIDFLRQRVIETLIISSTATLVSASILFSHLRVFSINGILSGFLTTFPALYSITLGLVSGFLGTLNIPTHLLNVCNLPSLQWIQKSGQLSTQVGFYHQWEAEKSSLESIYQDTAFTLLKTVTPQKPDGYQLRIKPLGRKEKTLTLNYTNLSTQPYPTLEISNGTLRIITPDIPATEAGGLSLRTPFVYIKAGSKTFLILSHLSEEAKIRALNQVQEMHLNYDQVL